MRTTLMTIVVAMCAILAATTTIIEAQATPRIQKVVLTIPQMDCGGCELAVKISVKKVTGVRDVTTNWERRVAEVSYDASTTSIKAIIDSIAKNSGFKAEEVKPRK